MLFSPSLPKSARRFFSCWNSTTSASPWMVSIAWAANSPAASLDLEPRSSTLLRIKKGLSPTKIKNGMKARATQGWVIVRKMTTTKGTSTETNAGATVWAKKYSTSSTS